MAPFIQYESESLTRALELPAEERKKQVTAISLQEGFKGFVAASVVWLPICAFLYKGNSGASHWFRTKLNNSGRTAVIIMPPAFSFGLVSEQVASRLGNPQSFHKDAAGKASVLPYYQQFANFIYDHPFRLILMISVPTLATTYLIKSTDLSLTLSQRLMHTRVVTQFLIVGTLLSTMGFYDYMGRRGRFLEPGETDAHAHHK